MNLNSKLKSDQVIERAKCLLEQNKEQASLKSIIEFMIDQNNINDDLNPKVIRFLIMYILPPIDDEKELSADNIDPTSIQYIDYVPAAKTISRHDINLRKNRLRTFVKTIFGFRNDEECRHGFEMTSQIKETFEKLLSYILFCIKKYIFENPDHKVDDYYKGDVIYTSYTKITLTNFNFRRNYMWNLKNILGPSKNPLWLYYGGLNTLLSMSEIMFEINQYWAIYFGNVLFQQIVPNSYFEILELRNYKWRYKLLDYNFLLTPKYRKYVYKSYYLDDFRILNCPAFKKTFTVSRDGILKSIVKDIPAAETNCEWNFVFENEIGRGRGVNQEFYALFSRDIQRYDHKLWLGNPQTSSDGVEYVNSPCGLFPSPCMELDNYTKNIFVTIGKVMAKSILDQALFDAKFSKVVYDFLTISKSYRNLNCLVDVMPHLGEFVKELVNIFMTSRKIKDDESLSEEEKSEALSAVRYHDCKLESLHVNFTVPGYPDMEMTEGGSDMFLAVENVENYLQLLAWWLLCRGPHQQLECIREGFVSVITSPHDYLLTEDMMTIFRCELQPWTVEELEQNCILCGELTKDSPIIENLFILLSKISMEEQKQFLMFVTGSPVLPCGGLANLLPKLTIQLYEPNGNPNYFLPCSQTCFNLLKLPRYSDYLVLKKKLSTAIRDGIGSFQFV